MKLANICVRFIFTWYKCCGLVLLYPLIEFPQIPKPNREEGLTIGWPQQKTDMDSLKKLFDEIQTKMAKL